MGIWDYLVLVVVLELDRHGDVVDVEVLFVHVCELVVDPAVDAGCEPDGEAVGEVGAERLFEHCLVFRVEQGVGIVVVGF